MGFWGNFGLAFLLFQLYLKQIFHNNVMLLVFLKNIKTKLLYLLYYCCHGKI